MGHYNKSSIVAALNAAGLKVVHYGPRPRKRMVLEESEQLQLIIIVGGDGSVAKTIRKLADMQSAHLQLPIAIIPTGTANNIARSLGIYGNPIDLAERWRLDRKRNITLGIATGPWGRRTFLESFGIGAFADLIKKGDNAKLRGPEGIEKSRRWLKDMLTTAPPLNIRAHIDGVELKKEVLFFEVANIAYSGPALKLSKARDGWLEVVSVPADMREQFCAWLAAPAHAPAPVVTHRAKAVEMEWTDAPFRIDDKAFVQSGKRRRASIERGLASASILVPD